MYRVTLKPGHPRGIYRRSGREFTREGPQEGLPSPLGVQIAAEEMTEEILNDPWLIVEQQAALSGGEWPEPAAELVIYIQSLEDEDIDELQDLLEWERANKGRKSVIKAAEERMAVLAARADPSGHEPTQEADHQED